MLNKVAADVCLTSNNYQLYKVSAQHISPPVIKIQSRFPFDLVAMDIMQFPKSSKGYVAVLVVVDHFSKFLSAVALKDKRRPQLLKR